MEFTLIFRNAWYTFFSFSCLYSGGTLEYGGTRSLCFSSFHSLTALSLTTSVHHSLSGTGVSPVHTCTISLFLSLHFLTALSLVSIFLQAHLHWNIFSPACLTCISSFSLHISGRSLLGLTHSPAYSLSPGMHSHWNLLHLTISRAPLSAPALDFTFILGLLSGEFLLVSAPLCLSLSAYRFHTYSLSYSHPLHVLYLNFVLSLHTALSTHHRSLVFSVFTTDFHFTCTLWVSFCIFLGGPHLLSLWEDLGPLTFHSYWEFRWDSPFCYSAWTRFLTLRFSLYFSLLFTSLCLSGSQILCTDINSLQILISLSLTCTFLSLTLFVYWVHTPFLSLSHSFSFSP